MSRLRGEPPARRTIGATLFELLTGTKAFPGSVADGLLYRILDAPAPALPQDVGGTALTDVVARAVEKQPDRRFQSAADFKLALAGVAGAAATVGTAPEAPVTPPAGSEVTAFRRRLIQSVSEAEIRRLKYEVDQFLALKPYDVDGRLLADDIERTMMRPAPSPAGPLAPAAGSASWKRAAAFASTFAVALVAVSVILMTPRGPVSPPSPALSPPDPGPAPEPSATRRPDQSESASARPVPPASAVPKVGRQALDAPTAPRPSPPPPVAKAAPPTRPAPAVPEVSDRPGVSPVDVDPDTQAIRALIGRFGDAMRRRDATALARLYPAGDVRAVPEVPRDAPLAMTIGAIRRRDDSSGEVEVDWEPQPGTAGTRLVFDVRKSGPGEWVIAGIRAR